MSDTDQPDGPGDSGGVFSNLPASRPGTRSPRRDRGKPGAAGAKARSARPKAAAESKTAAGPKAAARPTAAAQSRSAAKPEPAAQPEAAPRQAAKPKPQPEPQSREPDAEGGGHGGIEDLAWAGIAAAAEAATLGVRLASRAMGAVRDSVDRR